MTYLSDKPHMKWRAGPLMILNKTVLKQMFKFVKMYTNSQMWSLQPLKQMVTYQLATWSLRKVKHKSCISSEMSQSLIYSKFSS